MSNLKDIVYCTEEQLETMANGTPVSDHVYNENDLYITPLGEDIIVGSEGSGTKINDNNELIVDSTYVQNAVKDNIAEAKMIAEKAEIIAKGRATAYIYDTVEALDIDLSNPEFIAKLVKGDNFYIRALNVPDYWWDGTTKQQLETEKPDLSGVVKDVQINGTSIVTDGAANIPLGSTERLGVIQLDGYRGVNIFKDKLALNNAANWVIDQRVKSGNSVAFGAITTENFDYAVKTAMTDGKGAAWTEEEKIAARDRMGINDAITAALSAIGVAEEGMY